MLLVLNCLVKDEYAAVTDKMLFNQIKDNSEKYKTLRIAQLEKIPDLKPYTKLIISGSEASVTDDNSWDSILSDIIMNFINREKPVLGICYGHQFIVKSVLGSNSLRKSNTPEFGWAKININIQDNFIFKDLKQKNLYSMVSHYDEVYNLNDDFNVIAGTDNCSIHSFQYKKLPVWGVQFHPEFDDIAETQKTFDEIEIIDPSIKKHFYNDINSNERLLEQNKNIIKTFLSI
ncbi:MAG: type 1 glutamine amidotransferase [Spirochaetota bacterium]